MIHKMDTDISQRSTAMMRRRPDMGGGERGESIGSIVQSEECTTPTPRERTLSDASDKSIGSDFQVKNANFTYDSGNYSTSSNASDISAAAETDGQNHYERYQYALREKDQALFLAMQDVRKLRSELERLNKSEQWYKQELRTQKSSRLEALERLYAQERKYMRENQRLQRECMRLYESCGELEKELSAQREEALRQLSRDARDDRSVEKGTSSDVAFEIEQQRSVISDQEQLINVLRKQKRSLIEDLKRLTEEKDEKVLELQRALASLEQENNQVTTQCKRLLNEKRDLEEQLQRKYIALATESTEKFKLQEIVCNLKEDLKVQEQLVSFKEKDIKRLQTQFEANLKSESNMDEVHRLSMSYHEDINAKTAEIIQLKKSVQTLQEDLKSFAELQNQSEQQERLIENLNFTLNTQHYELENLKQADVEKSQQIIELQQNLEKFQSESGGTRERLLSSQATLRNLETELISLNEQYAEMCALCERTRFELELYEINRGKMEFQAENDRKEIAQLREKLKEYLEHIKCLSLKINELERLLDCKMAENEKSETVHITLREQCKDFTEVHVDTRNNGTVKWNTNLTEDTFFQMGGSDRKRHSLEITDGANEFNGNQLVENIDPSTDLLKDPALLSMTAQLTKLWDTLAVQCDVILENQHLSDAFHVLIDNENNSIETSNSLHVISENFKMLFEENRELKAQLHSTETNDQLLHEATQMDQLLSECVDKKISESQLYQNKLTSIGDAAESSQTLQPQIESDQNKEAESVDNPEIIALQNKNKLLCKEMQTILGAKVNIEATLELERNNVKELRSQLEVTEKVDPEELLNLREKVHELEDKLEIAMNANDERRERRIHSLSQLIQQQNNKVFQLNETQAEWEELLKLLNATQQLEENTRKELNLKHAELEELNELFAEQNEELCKLQELSLLTHCKDETDLAQLQGSLQAQVRELQKDLGDKLEENQAQKHMIEELQCKIESLERTLNEDYCDKLCKNQNLLRTLQTTIEHLKEDRNKYALRVAEMENELIELKNGKREALVFPEEFILCSENANIQSNEESTSLELSQKYTNDRLRLLTKVLEAEYKRKMKRYDLHIHTLLSNIKNLKKALRAAEDRAVSLSEAQSKAAAELRDFQLTRCHMEEMRLKLEQSQCTIKSLELALENERKKFETTDLGKATKPLEQSTEEHEVANLIDDYKKLIQQSAAATRRPKTSTVLDLIHRSNQFKPNLNKLETGVDGLRSDLANFLNSYVHNTCDSFMLPKPDVPSLLDELRAATENF